MIRIAGIEDLDFLDHHDPLLTRSALTEKLKQDEVYIAEEAGERVGLARFGFFCDLDPFLTLIYVLDAHRRRGIGTHLMAYWEQQMRQADHRILLTSTQADEEAQHFYRALGFVDTGAILFPGQVPAELVLMKLLREPGTEPGPRQKP